MEALRSSNFKMFFFLGRKCPIFVLYFVNIVLYSPIFFEKMSYILSYMLPHPCWKAWIVESYSKMGKTWKKIHYQSRHVVWKWCPWFLWGHEVFSKNLVGPWKFIRSYGGAIKIFGILNNLTQAPLTIVYVRSLIYHQFLTWTI